MFYIGVDLGKDGGIVVLDEEARIQAKHKTPLIKSSTKNGKKLGRDEYDLVSIRRIFESMIGNSVVVLERAQALPASLGGVSANYQRGFAFGIWQGILVGLGIPYEVVRPQTWQKAMFAGIRSDDTKQASVIAAQRIWPNEDWRRSPLGKKADDGLTDAALLALFGLRMRFGKILPEKS